MSQETKELKNLLHESIENIDDEELLKAAKAVLDRKYIPDAVFEPVPGQIERIEKANESIAKGEALTNEQADELVNKWLNE